MAITLTLSNDQKQTLQGHAGFAGQVKWAVLNKAAYWSTFAPQTAFNFPDAATAIRWAKSRHYGALFQMNPSMAENPEIVKQFLQQIKGVVCVDPTNTPFDPLPVVSFLQDDGTAQHYNNMDAAADRWFDSMIATNPF